MNHFNHAGLIEHSKAMLQIPTSYMWGTLARKIDSNMISWCKKTYPSKYNATRVAYLTQQIGKRYGCDCIGLIKSYYFGGIGSPNYDAAKDVNTNTMYQLAKNKGRIATLPELPGLILYMPGHVGIYIGAGLCIECTLGAYGDGVVTSKVSGRGWTHWLQCPYIEADPSEKSENSVIQTFDKDDKVNVKKGAKTYDGKNLASYVYALIYDVIEVQGNRVVIGTGNCITAALHKEDLVKK